MGQGFKLLKLVLLNLNEKHGDSLDYEQDSYVIEYKVNGQCKLCLWIANGSLYFNTWANRKPEYIINLGPIERIFAYYWIKKFENWRTANRIKK